MFPKPDDVSDAVRLAGEKLFATAEREADGRQLCVRVTLVGACGAHRTLTERRPELEAQLRAETASRAMFMRWKACG